MDTDEERRRLTGEKEEKSYRCYCIPSWCCWIMNVLITLTVVTIIAVVGILMGIYIHTGEVTLECTRVVRNCSVIGAVKTLANLTCKPSEVGGNFHVSTHLDAQLDDCAGFCCADPRCKMFTIYRNRCRLLSSCPVKVKHDLTTLFIPKIMTRKQKIDCEKSNHTYGGKVAVVGGGGGAITTTTVKPIRKDLLQYKMDLAVLLDGTALSTLDMFEATKTFIIDVASQVDLDPNFTRIYVIYTGRTSQVIKSFKITKDGVAKKEDYYDFIYRVDSLHFWNNVPETSTTVTLLETLYNATNDKIYNRKNVRELHVAWFLNYPKDLLYMITDILMDLSEMSRKIIWLFEYWSERNVDMFKELFHRKQIIADKAETEETPEVAAIEFETMFWKHINKTVPAGQRKVATRELFDQL